MAYTVKAQHGAHLSQEGWRAIEQGQVGGEHSRAVLGALRETLAELLGATPEAPAEGGPGPRGGGYKTLPPLAYAAFRGRVLGAFRGRVLGEEAAGGPQASPPSAGERGSKKGAAPKKSELIRMKHTDKLVAESARALAAAFSASGAEGPAPSELGRFLAHEIFEVRLLTLALCARATASAPAPRDVSEKALELDAAIHKFLRTVGQGTSLLNPSEALPPSQAALADLHAGLALLRARVPFDGVQLAARRPQTIFYTAFDLCLPNSLIRTRANQRLTLEALVGFAGDHAPFLLINRAPPGAGKSALLVPIAELLAGAGERGEVCELYVCAGQGAPGCVQFMQALYGASISFTYAYVQDSRLQVRRQHRDRSGRSDIYVGTADAIHLLLTTHEPEKRRGWLIVDEPTYGSDIEGSPACRESMRLLAALAAHNRKVVLLGATIPPPAALGDLVAHCGGGRLAEVGGDAESIQMACAVHTTEGVRVLPHHDCKDSAQLRQVAEGLSTQPFFARMYSVADLVGMVAMLRELGGSGPDLRESFDHVEGLRPAMVVRQAERVLFDAAETLTEAAVVAFCAPPPPSDVPVDLELLAVGGGSGRPTMLVDVDPEGLAMRIGAPLLKAMEQEGPLSVDDLYDRYAALCASQEREAAAGERRKTKGLRDHLNAPGKRGGGLRDLHGAGEDADAPRPEAAAAPCGGGGADEEAPRLKFPPQFQIDTVEHRGRWSAAAPPGAPLRRPVEASLVPRCNVPDPLQLLLLAGVGVLSSQADAAACRQYQAEVLRRAGEGRLALVITDHTACYGANLILSEVRLTPGFCALASVKTLEQAGGRLCRVGLTYSGRLVLPPEAAQALLAAFRAGDGAPSAEATNMAKAFRSEAEIVARLRREQQEKAEAAERQAKADQAKAVKEQAAKARPLPQRRARRAPKKP